MRNQFVNCILIISIGHTNPRDSNCSNALYSVKLRGRTTRHIYVTVKYLRINIRSLSTFSHLVHFITAPSAIRAELKEHVPLT